MKIHIVNSAGKTYSYEKQQIMLNPSTYTKFKALSKEKGMNLSKTLEYLMRNEQDITG